MSNEYVRFSGANPFGTQVKLILHFDKLHAIDDNDNVIFLHLGRGVEKQFGEYSTSGKVCFEDWVRFVNNNVLGVTWLSA